MMKFFYQSEKKMKFFFSLISPETQSKSKKLKEFNIFLKKLKFSPLILKNTCKIFMSQGLAQGLPCTEVFGPSLEPLLRLARIILTGVGL